jgi:broad specificity phosphatase PhoE
MNIVFVRHGESDHNQKGIIDTSIDSISMLTEEGVHQIKKTANDILRLEPEFKIIFTSPLKRCIQTSEILAEILHIDDIRIDDRLREIGMGDYNGKLLSEYPFGYINGSHNHEMAHSFGGETLEDVKRRTQDFDYCESIIVSHRAPIRVMTKFLTGGYEIQVDCGCFYLYYMKDIENLSIFEVEDVLIEYSNIHMININIEEIINRIKKLNQKNNLYLKNKHERIFL